MYVIKHDESGEYVAQDDIISSYTRKLSEAKFYSSIHDAHADIYGAHESVITLLEAIIEMEAKHDAPTN